MPLQHIRIRVHTGINSCDAMKGLRVELVAVRERVNALNAIDPTNYPGRDLENFHTIM